MAKVYCFSATGNSLYVAKEVASIWNADLISMSDDQEKICTDDVIGFVFPVYYWKMPKLVEAFIARLKIENPNAYIFTIITYGGMVYGVSGQVQQLLKKKNCSLSYANNIKCVENYIPVYKVNDTVDMHTKTEEKLKQITQELQDRKMRKPQYATFLNSVVSKFNPQKNSIVSDNFNVNDDCTKCASCVKICPVNNIEMKGEKPIFHHHCELCMACIHDCPLKAINYKDKTIDKQRYRNPHVSRQELRKFTGKK